MRLFLLAITFFAASVCTCKSQQYYLFAGGYTSGKNEGLTVYRFNTADGSLSFVSKVKSDNPSYLAISSNGKYIYTANEAGKGRTGFTSAFTFDKKNGILSPLNTMQVNANGPCYISVDETNSWLVTANYASGSVSVLKLKEDGSIAGLQQVIQHTGSSVIALRQKDPHAHTAIFSPGEKQLFTTDLGTDRINKYSFNAASATDPLIVTNDSVILATPGNGPRHIAFHPQKKWMYVINELAGTIDVFENKKQSTLIQTVSTDTAKALDKGSGDIHITADGKFLYATNRGAYNNIAIFKIDPKKGTLSFIGLQPALGKTPRNFIIDPTDAYLLVAHQNSDSIVVFKRDKATGLLTDTGIKIATGNPSCLKLLAID